MVFIGDYFRYVQEETYPNETSTLVGVHVRRGDYVNWIKRQYKGNPVDETYFHYCMKEASKMWNNVIFFVTR